MNESPACETDSARSGTPNAAQPGTPEVAFLFLTRGDVNHPRLWQDWMEKAGNPPLFSHSKYLEQAEKGFLKGRSVKTRIPTQWATITGPRAMLILLKEAMEQSSATHFVYLSESCIPIKSYAHIRESLTQDPRGMIDLNYPGRMGVFHMQRWRRALQVNPAHWRMHSNWCLLDRDMAACILEEDVTWKFETVFAPDEHYFGTLLAMKEYPREKIRHTKVTWDNWTLGSPAYFDEVSAEIMEDLAKSPSFFARKFRGSPPLAERVRSFIKD